VARKMDPVGAGQTETVHVCTILAETNNEARSASSLSASPNLTLRRTSASSSLRPQFVGHTSGQGEVAPVSDNKTVPVQDANPDNGVYFFIKVNIN
jgi:hypothetical protein